MSPFVTLSNGSAPLTHYGRPPSGPRSGSRSTATGPDAALAGALDALSHVPFSRQALRDAVVRYGTLARDAGASVADLRDTLDASLAPALAQLPAPVAAELRVHAGWWAAHGYHRAD